MGNTVSCIIRTYNEAKYIGKLIEVLRSQEECGEDVQIVIVDSGSTDSTVEIARNHEVNLIRIPKRQFNYSKALNLGIENSTGDLIVILSAHSIPCRNDWLHRIVAHFEDKKVAGVYCKQVPWPGAEWREAFRIRNTFGNDSKVFCKDNSDSEMSFSNAASCIRRSVWERHPFVIMPAAEDRDWASWAINNSYSIIYEAEAQVYHSHDDSCRSAARRRIAVQKAADLRQARNRNMFLTCKQAITWIYRDICQIISLKNCDWSKLKLVRDCFARGYWYLRDFNRKSD